MSDMQAIINDNVWTIEEKTCFDAKLSCNGELCKGVADTYSHTITLSADLIFDEKYSTLCHELAHAFNYETQVQEIENFSEEMLCNFVGVYGRKIILIAEEYFAEEEEECEEQMCIEGFKVD